jgi:hypothetical protein
VLAFDKLNVSTAIAGVVFLFAEGRERLTFICCCRNHKKAEKRRQANEQGGANPSGSSAPGLWWAPVAQSFAVA